jgi:hypothetical protein
LLNAIVPIPVTVKIDNIRLLMKEEDSKQKEDIQENEEQGEM